MVGVNAGQNDGNALHAYTFYDLFSAATPNHALPTEETRYSSGQAAGYFTRRPYYDSPSANADGGIFRMNDFMKNEPQHQILLGVMITNWVIHN